jgi:hypothetical protein
MNNKYSALYRASVAIAAAADDDDKEDLSASDGESMVSTTPRAGAGAADDSAHAGQGASAALKAASKKASDSKALDKAESGGLPAVEEAAPAPEPTGIRGFFARHGAFLSAVVVCQIGMIAFNIGAACCWHMVAHLPLAIAVRSRLNFCCWRCCCLHRHASLKADFVMAGGSCSTH